VIAGHTLENTGELAGFLAEHPNEVEEYGDWVFALGEASRWAGSDEGVLVPCASVNSAFLGFDLCYFHRRYDSRSGVLVSGGKQPL
jgi:hypothetical protein